MKKSILFCSLVILMAFMFAHDINRFIDFIKSAPNTYRIIQSKPILMDDESTFTTTFRIDESSYYEVGIFIPNGSFLIKQLSDEVNGKLNLELKTKRKQISYIKSVEFKYFQSTDNNLNYAEKAVLVIFPINKILNGEELILVLSSNGSTVLDKNNYHVYLSKSGYK